MPETNEQSQELDLTPVEGERPVPVGWWALFGGLIAFGVYYLWAYTPWLGGWSQGAELEAAGAGADGGGGNIFATIAFTALAVITAGAILAGLSRRKSAR
jgi:hypothetical protein